MLFRPEGKQSITSGVSTTISDGIGLVHVDPSSLLAAHTITMPANPSDRDICIIFFGGTIANAAAVVTALTISPNSGQALFGTLLTTAVGGDSIKFFYNRANTKWYKF